MKNKADYSQYKCPYEHLEKEIGHELKGPEGYKDVESVWCSCGYRGPVFYLDPEDLKLERKDEPKPEGELAEPEQISSVVCCNGLSIGITPPQSNITIMQGKHDIILRIEQINGTENDYRIIFNKEIFSTADEFAKEFIKIVETHVIKCL